MPQALPSCSTLPHENPGGILLDDEKPGGIEACAFETDKRYNN